MGLPSQARGKSVSQGHRWLNPFLRMNPSHCLKCQFRSWHIASICGPQHFGRLRSEAEVGWPLEPTDPVEKDP
jgi:hypothetical protein